MYKVSCESVKDCLRSLIYMYICIVIRCTMFLCKHPRAILPVLSEHYCAIDRQLLFLNQPKRKDGCRNIFMTKSSRILVSAAAEAPRYRPSYRARRFFSRDDNLKSINLSDAPYKHENNSLSGQKNCIN